MRKIIVLFVLVVAGFALAQLPTGAKKFTTDAGLNISGSTHAKFVADGEAQIRLWYTVSGVSVRAPRSAAGDTVMSIYDYVPGFYSSPTGIDSVHVVLVDATFVQLEWR